MTVLRAVATTSRAEATGEPSAPGPTPLERLSSPRGCFMAIPATATLLDHRTEEHASELWPDPGSAARHPGPVRCWLEGLGQDRRQLARPRRQAMTGHMNLGDRPLVVDVATGTGEPGPSVAGLVPHGQVTLTELAELAELAERMLARATRPGGRVARSGLGRTGVEPVGHHHLGAHRPACAAGDCADVLVVDDRLNIGRVLRRGEWLPMASPAGDGST